MLLERPFAPWSLIDSTEQTLIAEGLLDADAIGATASFIGRMRGFNAGDTVTAMQLEHYPGMAESQLEKIVRQARQEHAISQAFIAHRVGRIAPGEAIVLVVVWSVHRQAAFTACREMMENLKHYAPFWKKEITLSGARWLSENTPG